ncbi:hypothetical protein [Clostridium chrysemydis]|uniref:hypothetical protein n=1 Tax=Clostridium chrysemydis TaxID=2665504 RepID=UPI0018837594|nr:hypothetical protein [Clostridium chrysemydis]
MKVNKKRDRIKDLYIRGYNSKQISEIINYENRDNLEFKKTNREAVKKYVYKYFKEYKDIHLKNAVSKKEALKAVNYESKRYLSDKSFILKNRSAYYTKLNGDIVLKDEMKDFSTIDMPKILKNENKSL